MSASEIEDIVIVGAGEAGARAAIELRAQGFAGGVTLVGEERHPPYERPPLSKALLVDDDPKLPTIGDAARLEELAISRIAGVAAVAIERSEQRVRLADGRRLAYDRLVLATGARARQLTIPGADGTLTLRRFEDSLVIRDRLRDAKRVVIVGGGFIGLELAAAARSFGAEVRVVEVDTRLLRRSTPEALASAVAAKHGREGVELMLGAGVERFEGARVILADRRSIDADVVVAGVGAVPATELAAEAGLAIHNGVAVDPHLRTSDVAIFAVGDCASFPHPLFGGRRIRLEAWRNAFDQGAHVARTLLGADDAYAAIPWFWSDQYDITLQIAGMPGADDRIVRRDIGADAIVQFHLDADGRLVAAGGFGPVGKIAKDVRLAERLIAARAAPSPETLADPSANLKKLL